MKQKALGIVSVVIVIFSIAFIVSTLRKPTADVNHVLGATTTPSSSSTYIFASRNMQISIPQGWESVPPTAVKPAEGFGTPLFAIRRADGACTIAYINEPIDRFNIPPLAQVSFGTRTFTANNQQFDPGWWVLASKAPAGLKFSDDTRQSIAGAMLIAQNFSDNDPTNKKWRAFVLYNEAGGIVDQSCDADYYVTLASLRPYFENTSLTSASDGTLFAQAANRPLGKTLLLFIGADGIPRTVGSFQSNGEYIRPVIYKDKIYYVRDNTLFALDLFSDTESAVDSVPQTVGTVVDFLIVKNTVFLLAAPGPACTDTGKCQSVLYRGTLASTGVEKVVEAESSSIAGYDQAENTIYLDSGYGDAGCFWNTVRRVDLTARTVSIAQNASACAEEPGYDSAVKSINAITDRFKSQLQEVTQVRVRDGHLELNPDPLDRNSASLRFSTD
ncbi:MAG: hypothetical protein JO019_02065 [Candidatus Kaiserbacteria bacterium]|nr:hypothetical protein [Candidatus Kaiserbacteria bacterium]